MLTVSLKYVKWISLTVLFFLSVPSIVQAETLDIDTYSGSAGGVSNGTTTIAINASEFTGYALSRVRFRTTGNAGQTIKVWFYEYGATTTLIMATSTTIVSYGGFPSWTLAFGDTGVCANSCYVVTRNQNSTEPGFVRKSTTTISPIWEWVSPSSYTEEIYGQIYTDYTPPSPWERVDVPMYISFASTTNPTYMTATSTMPSPIGAEDQTAQFKYVLKTLPADNIYTNIANSDHCYPRGGGTTSGDDGFNTSLDLAVYHTSNTSGGSPDCSTAGTYYFVAYHSELGSEILYVGEYEYDGAGGATGLLNCAEGDCTYVASVSPADGDTLTASTTIPFEAVAVVGVEYFEETEGELTIEYSYRHALSLVDDSYPPSFLGSYPITESGTTTYNGLLSQAYATGTYHGKAQIIRTEPPAWYEMWSDNEITVIDTLDFEFFVGASTTAEELNEAHTLWEESITVDIQDTTANVIPPITEALNKLLLAPPWGYFTHIFNTLRATTTATSTIAITHTIPTGFPGEGETITLDVTQGITDAIARINSETVTTITGDPFDKFMEYWNLLWYIALVVWIMQQVFGMFQINLDYSDDRRRNRKGEEYQVKGRRVGASFGGISAGKYKQK